eukprot:TRINITY_DN2123_c0_g1_i1.p1 TRINITY_DN2123_c0_g1~~TRINITY_DN2123_c0_g1_i1.p1  ORF type:complete len:470 (+),score=94.50 TRINITY_DN2123_c0_g1_i1:1292-2701(+)
MMCLCHLWELLKELLRAEASQRCCCCCCCWKMCWQWLSLLLLLLLLLLFIGMSLMETGRGRLEEVVYEFTPEPGPPQRSAGASGGSTTSPSRGAAAITSGSNAKEGIDTSSTSAKAAFNSFAQKEAAEAASEAGKSARHSRRSADYEALGGRSRNFETPEQKLMRLQAEVADLLQITETSVTKDGPAAAKDLLGDDPSAVSTELRILEQRLAGLARDGPAAWRRDPSNSDKLGSSSSSMAGSLVGQLERLAVTGTSIATSSPGAASSAPSDGRQITYEINYAPSTASIANSSKIASMESSISDIEKQLGVLQSSFPYPDLHTAVTQLQKRVSLLDNQKLDSISKGVDKVMREIEQVLAKKAELEGIGNSDKDLDRKVSELYDFCHKWNATAASLPAIVTRLQSLQALHQQSASFASRLAALELQQDELNKLLQTTSASVKELGAGLHENMSIVRENMRTLEEKISKAVK